MDTHQILYSKQMILAKLNGWKTVTRRPIKPQPDSIPDVLEPSKHVLTYDAGEPTKQCYGINNFVNEYSPFGVSGDQLWTKENFTIKDYSNFEQSVLVEYTADQQQTWVQLTDADWEKYRNWKQPTGKKSKLFMFKTLSRFWDEVTDITVERIQDITAEEIYKEGIRIAQIGGDYVDDLGSEMQYKVAFHKLWQSMYRGGPFDWDNDPLVWVISYNPLIINHDEVTNELATA